VRHQSLAFIVIALLAALRIGAAADLSTDQLRMLQDAGGWQYLEMNSSAIGVQTEHPCFDGQPHPDECSGTLTFSQDNTFVQDLVIDGRSYRRHGTYQLDGDQLSLFDELQTQDGPYTLLVNLEQKTLVMQMSPSGGNVRCRFILNRKYQEKRKQDQQNKKKET
jgi:hypothetical protein